MIAFGHHDIVSEEEGHAADAAKRDRGETQYWPSHGCLRLKVVITTQTKLKVLKLLKELP
jgi:hypothetical protein